MLKKSSVSVLTGCTVAMVPFFGGKKKTIKCF